MITENGVIDWLDNDLLPKWQAKANSSFGIYMDTEQGLRQLLDRIGIFESDEREIRKQSMHGFPIGCDNETDFATVTKFTLFRGIEAIWNWGPLKAILLDDDAAREESGIQREFREQAIQQSRIMGLTIPPELIGILPPPTEIESSFRLLDILLTQYPTCLIVEDAHRFCPSASPSQQSMMDRMISDCMKSWGRSLDIQDRSSLIVFTTSAPEDIDSEVRGATEFIQVPLPNGRLRSQSISSSIARWNSTTTGDKLKLDADPERIAKFTGGLTVRQMENVLMITMKAAEKAKTTTIGMQTIKDLKTRMMKQIKVLEVPEPRFGFSGIGGLEVAKNIIINNVVIPLKNLEKMKKFGAEVPSGILLMGAPGTGKTLYGKATALDTDMNYVELKYTKISSSLVGATERNINEAFRYTKSMAPVIMFFDEIEAFASNRDAQGGERDGGTAQRTLGVLLDHMGWSDADEPLLVIAATNHPENMDAALINRFPIRVLLEAPLEPAREQIWMVQTTIHHPMVLGEDVDFKELANKTVGWVGRDIENATKQTGNAAVVRHTNVGGEEAVIQQDFLNVIERTKPSTSPEDLERFSRTARPFVSH